LMVVMMANVRGSGACGTWTPALCYPPLTPYTRKLH